jgi:hypothetical protein
LVSKKEPTLDLPIVSGLVVEEAARLSVLRTTGEAVAAYSHIVVLDGNAAMKLLVASVVAKVILTMFGDTRKDIPDVHIALDPDTPMEFAVDVAVVVVLVEVVPDVVL